VPAPAHLVDTNILLRIARRGDPDYAIVDAAPATLAEARCVLNYTHQNIAEFWNVATRPLDKNGFGLTVTDVDREIRVIEKGMVLLPDSEAVYHEWRRLVVAHAVSGVKVHDARLAAAMRVHGVTHLLTLNVDDFKRYTHITAVHPGSFTLSE
jgi:predicted nucleic acid-binding protein